MSLEVLAEPNEAFDGLAFLTEHGLEDLAETQIEAHGGSYSVPIALEKCKPFADMLTGLVVSLAEVPNRNEILTKTIQSMAPKTELPLEVRENLS